MNRIEFWTSLDRLSSAVQPLPRFLRRNRHLKNLLSGSVLGHPLHPLLTDLPIGCWTSAALLDFTGNNHGTSTGRKLIGFGIVLALPTALSGASDWLDTADAEQRVGIVHAAGNLLGLSLMTASWFRRGGAPGTEDKARGRLSMLAGLATISVSGWLGGHLSYAMGVGVDTNAFATGPDEWAPAREVSDEVSDGMRSWEVQGVRIVTIDDSTRIYAAADRCSHRGGPLSQGKREGYCVTCPWHESTFDIRDGSVMEGPATVAQPTYEVRRDADAIALRRFEPRSLRRNPV